MKRTVILLAALTLCSAAAPYQPATRVAGTIRIWGHPLMAEVLDRLARSFERFHPETVFKFTLRGSATAIPGLYSGEADIAFLGRENNLVDDNGFGRVKQYPPLRLEVMSGSLDSPGKADAITVLVHKDNPLRGLTLAQLDAVVSCEARRGHPPVRTWGDLGLGGAWRDRRIAVHMYDAETGTGIFIQRVVAKNSRKMLWDRIVEYRNGHRSDGSHSPAAERIVEGMRGDRYALGIASLRYATPELKAVPIADHDRVPYVLASRDSIVSRAYPLARRAFAFVDHKPGVPLEPKAAEFLRFVLSSEGQAAIAGEGGFLPLNEATLSAQRRILDEASR